MDFISLLNLHSKYPRFTLLLISSLIAHAHAHASRIPSPRPRRASHRPFNRRPHRLRHPFVSHHITTSPSPSPLPTTVTTTATTPFYLASLAKSPSAPSAAAPGAHRNASPRLTTLTSPDAMVTKEFLDSDRVNFLIWRYAHTPGS